MQPKYENLLTLYGIEYDDPQMELSFRWNYDNHKYELLIEKNILLSAGIRKYSYKRVFTFELLVSAYNPADFTKTLVRTSLEEFYRDLVNTCLSCGGGKDLRAGLQTQS